MCAVLPRGKLLAENCSDFLGRIRFKFTKLSLPQIFPAIGSEKQSENLRDFMKRRIFLESGSTERCGVAGRSVNRRALVAVMEDGAMQDRPERAA